MRARTKRLHLIERKFHQSVKEYARCAAGSTRSPQELRTPNALVKTTHFLGKRLVVFVLNPCEQGTMNVNEQMPHVQSQ